MTTLEKPKAGDYIRLGKSENHTTVAQVRAYRMWEQMWRVWDTDGEEYMIQRLPDYDTDTRLAWEAPFG